MNIIKIIIKTLFVATIIVNLNSCGIYRPTDAKEFPPEPEKRIAKNIQEGRGFKIFDSGNKGGGSFDFATSNEMWRATLDIINFMPLISADYGGGLIITDWYNDENKNDEAIKISIRFLTNEIRSDALEITVFSKKCEDQMNCSVQKNTTRIEDELKVAILKRAAKYKKDIDLAAPKRQQRPLGTIYPANK
jgi:hypothetical protein